MSDYVGSNAVLLVGTGDMGICYAKVLQAQSVPFCAVGRSESSCLKFASATGVDPIRGGVPAALAALATPPNAIVAASVVELGPVVLALLRAGIRRILVEKPGAMDARSIAAVAEAAAASRGEVFVAYNRRFYGSTARARRLIDEDGGVTSFTFEFTEWSHLIEPAPTPAAVKRTWFLANSSHVADLAFFLGGPPREMKTFIAGSMPWHPTGSVFVGAGISTSGALFSYHSNWDSAGRWGLEVLTRHRRLIFRPLEKLHVLRRGSVAVEEVPLDNDLDREFKPGLFLQTKAFLNGPGDDLLSIDEHHSLVTTVYSRIATEEETGSPR